MNFDALFSGELLRRRCGANGLSLLEKTQELVEKSLGREPEALDKDAFRLGLESCRARLSDESFVALGRGILDEVGIPRKGVMLDKLRLRAIAPGLEKIKQGTISLNDKILSSEKIDIEPENRKITKFFKLR